MYYIIDGYNLIFSAKDDSKSTLQSLRQKLITALQREFAGKKISGIIVFDGSHRRDEESGLSYPSPLTIAYTPKGQSADEYIIERVELSKTPKQITVISNDRSLIRHVKSLGAKAMDNDAFLVWVYKRKKRKKMAEPKDSPENIERLLRIFEKKLKESD